ncbi:MAG TPA: mannose-6-phosphate isomerase, class I [Kofleriaceae bacterium]|nr:mannose-6-phosphate isomerase, class I [Kofleriaceae bacterium]
MRRLLALEAPVQHYAWGSPEAIPALTGRASDGRPWAELWLGAHPHAPSRADGEPLDRLVAAHPELLGARVTDAFGARLPFLFKILAAARPLSIQAHPDAEAARRGFERENRLGVALDAPARTYRDASHKPELLCALGPFEALAGFRAPDEVRARFAAAGSRELAPELALLDEPDALARFVPALWRLDGSRRAHAVAEVAIGLARDPGAEAAWVRRLAALHPGDPGALAPLYLHHVTLAAGDAIYLGAGLLHSYLGGTGLELMASSDNVLRGGLTEKHIDIDELTRVVRFEPGEALRVAPARRGDLLEYEAPVGEFRLSAAELDAGPVELSHVGPAILLALGDACRVTDVAAGDARDLARGGALFVPAAVARVRLEGRGRAWLARVP